MNTNIITNLCFFLLFFSHSAFALTPITQLKQDLADFHARSGAGYSAIIAHKGETQYQDAIGLANIELNVALNIEHKFEIGSLTKPFTAVAVLQLVQSGQLKLTDNINQFISGISTTPHLVTIEHLLAHTSGLVDPINEPEFLATRVQEKISLDSLIDRFRNNHWQTKAGERINYSNVGYSMLAKIIENVSGLSYFEYLERHFLVPLNMKHTQQFSFAITPNKATGYTYDREILRNKDYLDLSWAYGAADLISAPEDLSIWFNALFSGQILTANYLKLLLSPITLNDGTVANGSYNFGLSSLAQFDAIRANGSTFGYSGHSLYLPEQQLYILVLSNSDGIHQGAWVAPATVAAKLAATYLQLDTPEFKLHPISETELRQYVGDYHLDTDTTRRLSLEGEQLIYQRNEGTKYPVNYMGDNRFYFADSFNHFQIVFKEKQSADMLFYYFLNNEPEVASKQLRQND